MRSARHISALLLGALVFAAPAAAAAEGTADRTAGDAETRAEAHDALFAALARSRSEAEARGIERAIWLFWMVAPNPGAQRLLERAMERRSAHDFAGAVDILDQLVTETPDYSEGWNQRATIRFLQGEYDRSLADIERTLALEPNHFGALAGQAIILMRQGRARLAQSALRRAVQIHPFLRERALLLPVPEEKI